MTRIAAGSPTTGIGVALLVVDPSPRTPSSPPPQAYTRPRESNSECVRAPVAAVTSVRGMRRGRSSINPGDEIPVGVESPAPRGAARVDGQGAVERHRIG